MLKKLEALTNLPPETIWKVENDSIVHVKAPKHRLQNAVDFLRSVRFTNSVLASGEGRSLNNAEVDRIFTPLLQTSMKIQASLERQPLWKRLFVTVIQFLATGTTISRATMKLGETVSSLNKQQTGYVAKLTYPKLMLDAETALKDKESYQAVGKKYVLPPGAGSLETLLPTCELSNPFLIHLRQAAVTEWREMRELIQSGKSLEDPEVMKHCDAALEVGLMLVKLAVSHELEHVYDNKERIYEKYELVSITENPAKKAELGRILNHQRNYPYWAVSFFGQLYKDIRSYPVYGADKNWHAGCLERRAFIEQFYQEGTRPSHWRNLFNTFCQTVFSHVDKEAFFSGDNRFYIEEDTKVLLDTPEKHKMGDHLRGVLEGDYLEKTILSPNW